jgi:hypothetical protein
VPLIRPDLVPDLIFEAQGPTAAVSCYILRTQEQAALFQFYFETRVTCDGRS